MSGKKVDLKVVMLGRQSVGKSALVDRFANDRWNPSITSTIGGSFCAKEVILPPAANNKTQQTVTLGVWDTAGSERYEALTRHYFSQAEAAFCCFDLTEIASWTKVAFWIEELHKAEPNCRVYIIGCKSDLIAANQGTRARGVSTASGSAARSRCVSRDEVERFCATITPEPAQYFETSALTGAGIQQAFQTCCQDWNTKPKREERQGIIQLDGDEYRRKKGILSTCCNQ